MKKNLLSRLKLRKKLQEYIDRKITLNDLQNWELKMSRTDFEPDDWEGDDSLINEVMHEIDMSDIDGLPIKRVKEIIKLFKTDKSTKILITLLHKLK